MPPASLADRLSRIAPLSNAERAAIVALESRERHVRRGAELIAQGERATDVFVLSQGIMASQVTRAPDWRRLMRLYLPGDLMTSGAMILRESSEAVVALSDCVVHPVARSAMGALLNEHARLAMLLMIDEQIEREALTRRMIAIETLAPPARVAALMIDIRNRLRAVDKAISNQFALALSPEQIGDAVGLKPAEAISAIQQLEAAKLMTRDATRICLADERGLMRLAAPALSGDSVELGWLPRRVA